MTRFMTFFRDHAQADSAVIAFAQYARVLDAEYALVIGQVAANTIMGICELRLQESAILDIPSI